MSAVLESSINADEYELLSRAVRFGSMSTLSKPIVKYFSGGSGATVLLEEKRKLNEIQIHSHNWSDPDRDPPSERSINEAHSWLTHFYDAVKGKWESPHISSTESGEICCEWWAGQRKISIFFTGEGVEFIRCWGRNIDTEMDSGELTTSAQFIGLWGWLGARERA